MTGFSDVVSYMLVVMYKILDIMSSLFFTAVDGS